MVQKRVTLLNRAMTSNASSASGGLCARVVKNGAYGTRPFRVFKGLNCSNSARGHGQRVVLTTGKSSPSLRLLKVAPVSWRWAVRGDNVAQRHYIEFANELDSYIRKYPRLASRFVATDRLNMEKRLTSDGLFHSFTPRPVYIGMTAGAATARR